MWAPHDPVSFFGHIIVGTLAYSAGLVAFWSVKGSAAHINAGRVFAIGMVLASATALVFMLNRLLPLALVMAIATLYLVGTGVLAIRNDRPYAPWAERLAALAPLLLAFFVGMQALRAVERGPRFVAGPALLAAIFLGLFVADLRLAWRRFDNPRAWRKRHLFRMVLAFGFATTAVLNINGGALGIPLEYTVVVPMGLALIGGAYLVHAETRRGTA